MIRLLTMVECDGRTTRRGEGRAGARIGATGTGITGRIGVTGVIGNLPVLIILPA
jgi:hypothetical protein